MIASVSRGPVVCKSVTEHTPEGVSEVEPEVVPSGFDTLNVRAQLRAHFLVIALWVTFGHISGHMYRQRSCSEAAVKTPSFTDVRTLILRGRLGNPPCDDMKSTAKTRTRLVFGI